MVTGEAERAQHPESAGRCGGREVGQFAGGDEEGQCVGDRSETDWRERGCGCSEDGEAIRDGGLGQRIGHARLDAFLATRAVMRVDRMLGRHDRGFLDVLDDALPLVARRTDRPAAVGAASQRVVLAPINPKRRTPVFAFVSGFLSTLLGGPLRSGLLVRRDLRRRFRDFAGGLGGGFGLRENAQFRQRA